MDKIKTRRGFIPVEELSPAERDCEAFGHDWPTELDSEAVCAYCGMPYTEWSEK